jgi:hypothetical protein
MEQLKAEDFRSLKLKSEVVEIPELGGEVTVWELTGLEADRLDDSNFPTGPDGQTVFRREGHEARLIIATVGDADGKRLFVPAQEAEVGAIPHSLIERLMTAVRRVNPPPVKAAENAAKN